ncbi:hypothetical protein HK405_005838 [Cladochytrium tenue]|nr:hypothetical protein HK405_005838 [Cladochytrium tenue]
MISLAKSGGPYSWRDQPKVLEKFYQRSQMFPFIAISGMYFPASSNGTEPYMGIYPSGTADLQDLSTNNSFYSFAILSANKNGTLTLSPNGTMTLQHISRAVPLADKPNGLWTPSLARPGPKTYAISYQLPVWAGLRPFERSTNTSESFGAVYYSLLSVRSLDAYLQQIPMTANGVLAVIEGATGRMLGATTPGISEAWPNQFDAVGNPNPLVSVAATEVARRLSPLDPAVNGTAAIAAIADRGPAAFTFNYGGEPVFCDIAWIVDDSSAMSMLLLLAIPSSDFLAAVNTSIRNAIIFVALFGGFTLIVAVLLSWAIVDPLRRLVVSIVQAAKFDFSSLNTNTVMGHSWLIEIGTLESSFFTILKKFAEAVQRNKSLITGGQVELYLCGLLSGQGL